MDTAEDTVIPGTQEPLVNPVFSPDGEWVAFFSGPDRQLKKVLVTGGASVPLGEAINPFGISWSADNTIVFGQPDGIWRVSANGGKAPERILDAQQGEQVDMLFGFFLIGLSFFQLFQDIAVLFVLRFVFDHFVLQWFHRKNFKC